MKALCDFQIQQFCTLDVKVQNFKKSLIANQTTLKNKFLYLFYPFICWIRTPGCFVEGYIIAVVSERASVHHQLE